MSKPPQFDNSLLKLRPTEVEIPETGPLQNDKLGREQFLRAMVDLIVPIQEPLVMALNAPWGSGKTTVINMLSPLLKERGVLSLTFSAWEVDNAADPLVPLVSFLESRLLDMSNERQMIDSEVLRKIKAVGNKLAKHAVMTSLNVVSAGQLSSGLVDDLIGAFQDERDSAKEFRLVLRELVTQVRSRSSGGAPSPFILFIDDLDRCKPTFAIAMLERIKHFFDEPGLVFVLCLDLDQLKASTRKVYGAEIDATEYLRRFVDLEIFLPRSDVTKMVESMLSSCGADQFFEVRSSHPMLRKDKFDLIDTIKVLSRDFDLSLRIVQRMILRMILVIGQTQTHQHLDPILVVFFVFLRVRCPALLTAYFRAEKTPSEVMLAIRDREPNGERFYESPESKLIEAYLLSAEKGRNYDYVQNLVQKVNLEGKDASRVISREQEVVSFYEGAGLNMSGRAALNLRELERKIDLVSEE